MATAAQLGAAFLLAFATALAATPIAIRIAKRTAFYDRPEGYKAHPAPTPYLGGAAVLSALAVGGLVFADDRRDVGLILVGAVGLWLVGTADDRRTLRPAYRLTAAALAAVLLWASGVGWHIFPTEGANLAVTILWVVGLVNAFNLMDNMDGAASAVASTSAAGTAVLALVEGAPHVAGIGLALAGACLGFLRYNLASPARIFLGDGGSMLIGFVLAASTMSLQVEATFDWRPLLVATLFVGLVVFDTALVIGSRWRRHVAVYQGGRDHVTHRVAPRLGSARTVATLLAAIQATLCGLAVIAATGGASAAFVVGLLFVAAAVVSALMLELGPIAVMPRGPRAASSPGGANLFSRNTRGGLQTAHKALTVVVGSGEARRRR